MDAPPLVSSLPLTPQTLTLAKERTYFTVVLVFSVLVWALLVITIFGLFYAALFAVMLWLANGLMVARLRSESIRVHERQLPELYAAFQTVCARLGQVPPPALYVVQAGGSLNAFAARHAGRGFVVIFSDFLEALGPDSPEVKFILGHEIGHIKSRHLLKQILLAPGLFLPLIGPAYRRSWESSCDRFGAYAANDLEGAVRAMLILGGGRERGRRLDAAAFAAQHRTERGFFVSLHELTSTYPTLSRRVTDLLALRDGRPAAPPVRHPLAYFPALVMPGGQTAAPANALVLIVVIGLLAAMAIPAFEAVRQASIMKVCHNNLVMLNAAADQFVLVNGRAPSGLSDLVGRGKLVATTPVCLAGGHYEMRSNPLQDTVRFVCSVHGSEEDLQRDMQQLQQRRR